MGTIRTWCSRRARLLIVTVAMTQLVVGTAIVTVRGQTPQTIEEAVARQRTEDRIGSIETRLTIIDQLRVAERLALLDDMKARIGKIEMLTYGSIVTLMLNLLGTLVQIRGQKDRH